MEQETKTVTMPLSEFEEIRSKAAQYTALRDTIKSDLEIKYKDSLDKISDEYCKYYQKYSESEKRVRKLESEIKDLKSELEKYKSRKWWQIWKH